MTVNNINVKNEKEIKELLVKFQKGYKKRDKAIADDYMKDIFVPGDEMVILGTSFGEWCLGYAEAKDLVESDWEYWGDVRIDIENPTIIVEGNSASISINGTLKYEFVDSEERYNGYLNLVKDHFSDEGEYSQLDSKVKLTKVKWILAHFMAQRKEGTRAYNWPLRINGVLIKIDGSWKFKYMQFFLPNTGYPDARVADISEYNKVNEKDYEKLKRYITSKNNSSFDEIKSILSDFELDYLSANKSSMEVLDKYFANRKDIRLVDADDLWNVGYDYIKESIDTQRNKWDKVSFEKDLAVIGIEEDMAWLSVSGIANKKITEKEAIMSEIGSIKNICNKDIASKEKLFQIHRNISRMMMETSIGEEYIWPIRLEAILIKENESWKLHSVQFSHPFYWILEGMYDVPALD